MKSKALIRDFKILLFMIIAQKKLTKRLPGNKYADEIV